MKKLQNNDLYNVEGGAVKWGVLSGIAAAISFIMGFIDGYTNPKRCNN